MIRFYYNRGEKDFIIVTPSQVQCRSRTTFENLFSVNFNKINDVCVNPETWEILVADNSNEIHSIVPPEDLDENL